MQVEFLPIWKNVNYHCNHAYIGEIKRINIMGIMLFIISVIKQTNEVTASEFHLLTNKWDIDLVRKIAIGGCLPNVHGNATLVWAGLSYEKN